MIRKGAVSIRDECTFYHFSLKEMQKFIFIITSLIFTMLQFFWFSYFGSGFKIKSWILIPLTSFPDPRTSFKIYGYWVHFTKDDISYLFYLIWRFDKYWRLGNLVQFPNHAHSIEMDRLLGHTVEVANGKLLALIEP